VLRAWELRKAEVCRAVADVERRTKAIEQKLDRLAEAFLLAQSIDIETYDRHKNKLRQELTLLQIGFAANSRIASRSVEIIVAESVSPTSFGAT
jgi:hypothetical protein